MSQRTRLSAMRSARTLCAAALIAHLCSIASTLAGGGPENVIVVVNTDSWASMAVANEFVHLRRIPACNVVYLAGLPSFETVDVDTFREKILKPVLQAIQDRKLSDQIDCITYSADLPYAINVRKDLGKKKLPRIVTPVAAINGLTYLYQDVLAKDVAYLRLDRNRYMRRRLKSLSIPPPTEEERTRHNEALKLMMEKKWAEAEPILRRLARQHPESPRTQYNLACCLAQQKKNDEAIQALTHAVDNGWMNHRHARKDKDIASLREREDFRQLLRRMENMPYEIQPTCAFRSTYEWGEKGGVVTAGGKRYMLSTVLASTSGRGNSVREAVECLRRSARADGTRPNGTIYYAVNDNIRSTTRDWSFKYAIKELSRLGVKAEIVTGKLPKNKPDVQGAMIGTASFNWKSSGSTILPGAICEHLTSCGGILREKASQTPLTELIRYGAAGASGTVTEPYAIQAKFPTAFVHVHYTRGCTLAEAFYQSVHGPYQLLIVGDPLCRPWARIPKVIADGIKPNAMLKGKVRIRPRIEKGSDIPIQHFELFVDGRRVAACKPSERLELDTTALADGHRELRVVAVAGGPIETQGRTILPIEVGNHRHRIELEAQGGSSIPLDRSVRLHAKLAGAKEIQITHNARTLATIRGAEGETEISARELGLGNVTVQAVGILTKPEGVRVLSRPVRLNVVPPNPLPAVKLDPKMQFTEGLELIRESGKRIVVYDTYPSRGMSGFVKPGEQVELVGYFDIKEKDVYQFQVHANFPVEIEVDSVTLGKTTPGSWALLPVALAPGTHKIRIRGTVVKGPRLDIRFGGPGAQHLSGLRFKRPVPAQAKSRATR